MKKILFTLTSALIAPFILAGSVLAAGTAKITAELSASSVTTGTNFSANVYVTTSGAATSGGAVRVNLSGSTFVSYDATGSPFSQNSITAGGTAGASYVTVFFGYTGSTTGTGKQLIGKVTALAGAVGTAQVSFAEIAAYDDALNDMTGSSTPSSITVAAAPSNPTPSQPSQPSNPSTGGSTQNQPTSSNTTTQASQPTNKVAIPDTSGKPQIVAQSQTEDILKNESPAAAPVAATVPKVTAKKKSPVLTIVAVGVSAGVLLLGLGIGVRQLMLHRAARLPDNYISGATTPNLPHDTASTGTPTSTEQTQQMQQQVPTENVLDTIHVEPNPTVGETIEPTRHVQNEAPTEPPKEPHA